MINTKKLGRMPRGIDESGPFRRYWAVVIAARCTSKQEILAMSPQGRLQATGKRLESGTLMWEKDPL
jgi:hypothetical protein